MHLVTGGRIRHRPQYKALHCAAEALASFEHDDANVPLQPKSQSEYRR
jgi:hypothetical protein